MRKRITRIAAALALLIGAGCGGGGASVDPTPTISNQRTFNAFVVQPVAPFFVTPGVPFVIVIQLVPINGFVLGAPLFFNNFIFANPSLAFGCPSLVTIGTPFIGTIAVGGVPTIGIPISPIGFGTCALPINLGLSGVFTFNVQISGSPGTVSKRRGYFVRVTRDSSHP